MLVIPNEGNNMLCIIQLHTLVRNFKPIIVGGWWGIVHGYKKVLDYVSASSRFRSRVNNVERTCIALIC